MTRSGLGATGFFPHSTASRAKRLVIARDDKAFRIRCSPTPNFRRTYFVGDDYTIVDIAAWGWIDRENFVLGEGRFGEFPNIARWFAGIDERPAVARAHAIGKDLAFKREMDGEARSNLFAQNYVPV
ncbi:MAG: glutathione binding-like protein [Fimbriimonadales bacterium]